MASHSFGTIFKIMTWGESHGKAMGVVIDGCPAGLELEEKEINEALALRAPGRTPYISPRKEKDEVEILSGLFQGKTTGTPLSLLIPNQGADSSKYESTKDLLKPGHAHYTYLEKYGIFDYRGGGRASGRETVCRVAAGVIAKKILRTQGIDLVAYIKQIGTIEAFFEAEEVSAIRLLTHKSSLFCPDVEATTKMEALIEHVKKEGDSLGGRVEFRVSSPPSGLGDPIYEKLEANLAHALMSLPASKGVEIGTGFQCVSMRASEHNDLFLQDAEGKVRTQTNHAGGILGGISTGMPIQGSVAFKPPSSIMKAQPTLTLSGEHTYFQLPEGSRHDPCVAIRAVPVVEAMVALVLVDAFLLNRCVRL